MKALLVVLLALLTQGSALGATSTATQVIAVQVQPTACLTIDSARVSFPPDDARAGTRLAQIGSVAIRAEALTSDHGNVTLSVLATSDLESATDSIPIGAVSWTGSGTGFLSGGFLSDKEPQAMASWDHSGVYNGTITYSLTNEWDYAAGLYTTTVTYTLTAL